MGNRGEISRRKMSDQRERRREEITTQLYSSSENHLRGGYPDSHGLREVVPETSFSSTPNHIPIPTHFDLTAKESDSKGTQTDMMADGDDKGRERRVPTGEERGRDRKEGRRVTVDCPTLEQEERDEQFRGKEADEKEALERPEGKFENGEPGDSTTGGAPGDPFVLPGKLPAKLPPLKSKGTLPPITPRRPPEETQVLARGSDQAEQKEGESSAEEIEEELEEEEEKENDESSTNTPMESVEPRPPPQVNETLPPIPNEKRGPTTEPHLLVTPDKQASSSQMSRKGRGEGEGGQTDHLTTRETPREEGQGTRRGEKKVAAPSSVVSPPPKRPANLEVLCVYILYCISLNKCVMLISFTTLRLNRVGT